MKEATVNPRYPIGIQTFRKIREGNYLYVDKTEFVHSLVSVPGYYFLSRPRRFGKSVLLSTIEAFYQGERQLFKGLAIDRYDHDWQEYPVLHLDFTGRNYNAGEELDHNLDYLFSKWEAEYGVTKIDPTFGGRFQRIIENAYAATGRKVVILIDEYDKPLLESVNDPGLQERYRDELKGVYGNLKRMDPYIEFAMLTGVTKFGKLSIFSDLNNLRDISLNREYSSICGITERELRNCFGQGVRDLAESLHKDVDEAYDVLKLNYDGYHFSPGGEDIYNPFSILNALADRSIRNYWYSTGTPSFLIKTIRDRRIPTDELNHLDVSLNEIMNTSFDLRSFEAVMYQSGYLTIKSYDPEFDIVTLGYPNREVERSFTDSLLRSMVPAESGEGSFSIEKFVRDLRDGRVDDFMRRLQSLFAGVQYDQIDFGNLERDYQNIMYLIMTLVGYYTRAEVRTSSGRIDLTVETPRYVYIFEFKVNSTAEAALRQINDKGYALPFQTDMRHIVKIGANFSNTTRTLDSWLVEEV